jgi:elongation factor P--(R)-beta-lysine ligase
MLDNWRPTASFDNLLLRTTIVKDIRQFFEARGVLEVDTPLLGHSTVTAPHLNSFETQLIFANAAGNTLYLQTSPEYAMKRLLAAGSGSIYQICKAFRNGEVGRNHNPEFTLLEWYRVGMTYMDLMDEVDTFLKTILKTPPATRMSYHALFNSYFSINPHTCSTKSLAAIASEYGLAFKGAESEQARDDWLDLLLTHLIEPHLGPEAPLFVYDYPESQAALAKTHLEDSYKVGERFEVYYKGLELANGC